MAAPVSAPGPSPAEHTEDSAPGGPLAALGKKLMDARLQVPVKVGSNEDDVYEAPLRVHSGLDGVSKALAGLRMDAPRGSSSERSLRTARGVGRGLVVVGAVLDVRDIARSAASDRARDDGRSTETRKALGRVAGGWGGALAGAQLGAKAGALLPFGGPVAGMVLGSMIGGITGHIAGERLASS
ncbi:MAG: hypothetical protein AAFZ18_37190 [Myxococcota bacterium]